MKKFFVLFLLLALGTVANATNDISKADKNHQHTSQGISNTTGEIRNLRTDDSGNLVMTATGTITATGTVFIDDNGGSITVDGTFWQATQPVSGTVTATGTVSIGDGVNGPVDVLTGTMNSLNVSVTDGTNRQDVKSNGAAQVALEILSTFEYDNDATVAAAATQTFTATATSTMVMICAECGGTTYFRLDGVDAADDTGMMLMANSCFIGDQGQYADIRIYNDHSANCKYAVQWRR